MDAVRHEGWIGFLRLRFQRKLVVFLLTILFFVNCISFLVITDDAEASVSANGYNWTLDDGVLTISKIGFNNDYSPSNRPPWYEYSQYIVTAIISDGVQSISDFAFYECTSIEQVTIPDSVNKIGQYSFYGCVSLKSVTIPKYVYSIGTGAFCGCTSLTSFYVSDQNQHYYSNGGVLFKKTTNHGIDFWNLPSLIQYPAGKTSESYSIPANTFMVEDKAFQGCIHLKFLDLSAAHHVGIDIFNGCDNLLKIQFGNSLVVFYSISSHRFYASDGVTELTKVSELRGNLFIGSSIDKMIRQDKHSVTYDSDGGTAPSPVQDKLYAGESFQIESYSGGKFGYTFEGWMYDDHIYSAGDSITMGDSDIILKACWKPVENSNVSSAGPIVIGVGITLIMLILGGFVFIRRKI